MEAQSTASRHRDLISMSHVCKPWREAVISYPLLWNAVYYESEMTTRMCLERSKTLPLTVTLSNFGQWSNNTLRLVGSRASRFEKLHLEGSVPHNLSLIFLSLTPDEGSLLLRELGLFGTQPLGILSTYEHLRSPILSEDIPTLHKLALSSFPLVPQMSVLRHLTELSLKDPGAGSTNSLLDLLANNPSLQRVGIAGPLSNQNSPRGDLSISLPHLRSFQISMCSAVDILRCLHLPRSEHLRIDIQTSFGAAYLPGAYQPYSVIQLFRDLELHQVRLDTHPRFNLEIHNSVVGITAGFGELPPRTAEVLGPLTVQFIKYLRFWEDRELQNWHPPSFSAPLHRMVRLETLALDCSAASLDDILFVLIIGETTCPALRTLIIVLPEDEPTAIRKDTVLKTVSARASRGNAIWRLRIVVPSEEHVPLYSGIFDPFVQEIETVAVQLEQEGSEHWLVWED